MDNDDDIKKALELFNGEKYLAKYGHIGDWTKSALIINLLSLPPVEDAAIKFDTTDTENFKAHVILRVSPESILAMNVPGKLGKLAKTAFGLLKNAPFNEKISKLIELSPHSNLPIFKGNRDDLKIITKNIVNDLLVDYKISVELTTEELNVEEEPKSEE